MRFHQAILWSIVYVMCKNNYLYLMLKYFLQIFAFGVKFSPTVATFWTFFTVNLCKSAKNGYFIF